MQDAELLAQYPADNKQRFNQYRQVGKVLDQLPDARLELGRPDHAHLEAEVAQRATQVIDNGNGPGLQKLAVGQQHPQVLTAQRPHMDRAIKNASSARCRGHHCGPSC